VLSIADRVVFLENGRNHPAITTAELEAKPELLTRFVGV
jgi:ABC-type branched-subunit amino acid transport system ATPase component